MRFLGVGGWLRCPQRKQTHPVPRWMNVQKTRKRPCESDDVLLESCESNQEIIGRKNRKCSFSIRVWLQWIQETQEQPPFRGHKSNPQHNSSWRPCPELFFSPQKNDVGKAFPVEDRLAEPGCVPPKCSPSMVQLLRSRCWVMDMVFMRLVASQQVAAAAVRWGLVPSQKGGGEDGFTWMSQEVRING